MTFSDVPMMTDNVKIPAQAAGGMDDVRSIRAELTSGAEGV
ncbi:nitronate monooxygenase [Pantoea vagans]